VALKRERKKQKPGIFILSLAHKFKSIKEEVKKENPKPIKVKSAWANGSLYLFVLVVLVAGSSFLGQELSFPVFCVALIGRVLLVPIVGALQLKQDKRLQEETFL